MLLMANITEQLKLLRQEAGMSTYQVASEIGIEQSAYAYYETKRYKRPYIPGELAQRLADLWEKEG